mmetsp:Transcript_17867/g.25437  ORF Transcript_17867/g.25437 Transcript_17867/m.25437 type:complete len:114 (+) Transcript_17867:859-1200(+)
MTHFDMIAFFSIAFLAAVTSVFIRVVRCEIMLGATAKMAEEMLHLAVATTLRNRLGGFHVLGVGRCKWFQRWLPIAHRHPMNPKSPSIVVEIFEYLTIQLLGVFRIRHDQNGT